MAGELDRLLNPRSIVVIGGKEAERVVEQCDKFGFDGTIWPINPKRESMHGRPCLSSLDDLPEVPDAAYVAVNRQLTIPIVEQLFFELLAFDFQFINHILCRNTPSFFLLDPVIFIF